MLPKRWDVRRCRPPLGWGWFILIFHPFVVKWRSSCLILIERLLLFGFSAAEQYHFSLESGINFLWENCERTESRPFTNACFSIFLFFLSTRPLLSNAETCHLVRVAAWKSIALPRWVLPAASEKESRRSARPFVQLRPDRSGSMTEKSVQRPAPDGFTVTMLPLRQHRFVLTPILSIDCLHALHRLARISPISLIDERYGGFTVGVRECLPFIHQQSARGFPCVKRTSQKYWSLYWISMIK